MKDDPAYKYLANLSKSLPAKPKALVVISAHWEQPQITVTSSTKLIYDFYGFPSHMYKATWPVPEDVDLAKQVVSLIQKVAPEAQYDSKRGIDHGTWSPLKIVFPKADIPVVQVSLHKNLDLAYHVKIGESLRSLASENVLIIASGGSTHNLGAMFAPGQTWAAAFEKFVADSVVLPTAEERNAALIQSSAHPQFRKAHPREEHFVPLLVAAGAAGGKAVVDHFSWATPSFGLTQVKFDAYESL
jgi:aromatic ring-opening dioxygenase catalytic subunit (LigB family)